MNTRRIVLLCVVSLLALGIASGAVFTLKTITLYTGVCEKVDGYAGLLQSAGLVPIGECALVNHACPVNHECTVAGRHGTCKEVQIDNHERCLCEARKKSP